MKRTLLFAAGALLLASSLAVSDLRAQDANEAPGDAVQQADPSDLADEPTIEVTEAEQETADETDATELPPGSDRLETIDGDKTACTVIGIDGEGRLQFSTPWLMQPALANVKRLSYIKFGKRGSEQGSGMILTITNGDQVAGQLVGSTEEHFIVESPIAGSLQVPRRVVESIRRMDQSDLLLDTDFSDGELGPWKAVDGNWKVDDGAMVCSSAFDRRTGIRQKSIAAQVPQKGSITIEAKMESPLGWQTYYQVDFFADQTQINNTGHSMGVQIQNGYMYAWLRTANRGQDRIGNGNFNMNNQVGEGVVRIAFDAENSELFIWMDEQQIGKFKVNNPPKTGKFVCIRTMYGERTDYVRIYPGVVPPGKSEQRGNEDADVVVMGNGDRFSATDLAVRGKELVANVGGMDLPFPMDKMQQVIMRTKDRELPRRNKGDVRVSTPYARLTLQLAEMTSEAIIGRSGYLGDLTIDRSVLRRMDFNIYRAPRKANDSAETEGNDSSTATVQIQAGAAFNGQIMIMPK